MFEKQLWKSDFLSKDPGHRLNICLVSSYYQIYGVGHQLNTKKH